MRYCTVFMLFVHFVVQFLVLLHKVFSRANYINLLLVKIQSDADYNYTFSDIFKESILLCEL